MPRGFGPCVAAVGETPPREAPPRPRDPGPPEGAPPRRLNTPAGKPASSIISAKIIAQSGLCSEGFRIMVQPATAAAPTFRVIWFIGQFHGVIIATTPTASITIRSLGA